MDCLVILVAADSNAPQSTFTSVLYDQLGAVTFNASYCCVALAPVIFLITALLIISDVRDVRDVLIVGKGVIDYPTLA